VPNIAKPVVFEQHALDRMVQRGVSQEQVELAVEEPDVARPTKTARWRRRLEKRVSRKRRLVVIVEERPAAVHIVTVFWM